MNDTKVWVMLAVNISVLVGMVLYMYGHKPEFTLQVIDIGGIIQHEVRQVAALRLSDRQREQRAIQFSHALSKSINEAASTFPGPIVVAAAVVQGGEDHTAWVQGRLNHWMSTLPNTDR